MKSQESGSVHEEPPPLVAKDPMPMPVPIPSENETKKKKELRLEEVLSDADKDHEDLEPKVKKLAPKTHVKTVGGAFVVGTPVALTFEELMRVGAERPLLPHQIVDEVDAGTDSPHTHPLDMVESPSSSNALKVMDTTTRAPIAREDWYCPHGRAYRLPLGKNSRRHMVYDVCFSGQSIGLTLSYKHHVFVQALTGIPAHQLGIIAKGDIILSVAGEKGWMRANTNLRDMTDFIKANGRPILIRFWRRPEPLQLSALLQSNAPLELFLNFIHRYIESPSYKEISRNEQLLAIQIRELQAKQSKGESENFTDMDEEEDDDDDDENDSDSEVEATETSAGGRSSQLTRNGQSGATMSGDFAGPATPRALTNKFLNTAMAQVMFLVEVGKIHQMGQTSSTTGRYSESHLQTSIRKGVAAKYLQRRGSDFSIKDMVKQNRQAALARKEVVRSGSIQCLEIVYQYVLESVRNDSYALFLHEDEAVKCLEKMGEKNGWKLRLFSSMVRSLDPIDLVLSQRKTCYALLLFLTTLTAQPTKADGLNVATSRLILWTMTKFSGNHTSSLYMDRVSQFKASVLKEEEEFNEQVLLRHVKDVCEPFYRQVVQTDVGRVLADAFNQAAKNGEDPSTLDQYMPRTTPFMHVVNLPENFVIHRAPQELEQPKSNAKDITDGESSFQSCIFQAVIFKAKEGQDTEGFSIIAKLNEQEPIPPQIDRFFIPHGTSSSNASLFFPSPLVFNFLFGGRALYGCSLVLPDTNTGICVLTKEKKMDSLKKILNKLYNDQESRKALEEGSGKIVLTRLLEIEQETTNEGPEYSVEMLFELLSPENIVKLLECCLLERKVLLVSSKYTALTVVCEAIRDLLEPLQWCHVYAPVLPRTMLDHLECPTPFIIGINSFYAFKKDFPYLLDAVVVNLDDGTVEIPSITSRGSDLSSHASNKSGHGHIVQPLSEKITLPPLTRDGLITELRSVTQRRFPHCDSVVDENKDIGNDKKVMWEKTKVICHEVVTSLLQSIQNYCIPIYYEQSSKLMLFDEAAFLSTIKGKEDHDFYSAFLRTQALSSFIGGFL